MSMALKSPSPVSTTFKRVTVGAQFTAQGALYRKASKRGAFRIKGAESLTPGVGETHKQVPFTRSAAVSAEPESISAV